MTNKQKTALYTNPILSNILGQIGPAEQCKTDKKMLLAAKIDDAIKAKGWKKKDFAAALNKKPSEITKWLSGTHNFTADTLWEIERVLDIELISLENKPKEIVFRYQVSAKNASLPQNQPYYNHFLAAKEQGTAQLTKSYYTGNQIFNTYLA